MICASLVVVLATRVRLRVGCRGNTRGLALQAPRRGVTFPSCCRVLVVPSGSADDGGNGRMSTPGSSGCTCFLGDVALDLAGTRPPAR